MTASRFGGWTLIGAEQTATGYEIAFYDAGSNQYTVWYTDSSGNMVSNASGYVSGTSAALESLETSFHQDLNGDGTIGVPVPSNATLIECIRSGEPAGGWEHLSDSSCTAGGRLSSA